MQEFSPQRYDKMLYRRCGRWGLKLPAISLGAWETYGGYRGEETAREWGLGVARGDDGVLVTVESGTPGRSLGFVSHLDTVPAGALNCTWYCWPGVSPAKL